MLLGATLSALTALTCLAQAPSDASALEPGSEPAELAAEEDAADWSFSLSTSLYIIEDDQDYLQTTFTADHDWLHIEARHQYEDLDTASLWLGCNFSFGDELTLDLTPMLGVVFGDTDGLAPGYELTLAWRQFELYTEGEFVFDADDSDDNFFYSWSELTWSPTEWLRGGLAVQRTKIREEDTDFELGPMLGATWNALDFSAYLLFPEEGDPSVLLSVGIEF